MPRNSTQMLTAVDNAVYGPTGLPVIRSNITIAGNNSTIRRAGTAPSFRIFGVGETGDLILQRTTLSGGQIGGNGGVFVYDGALTLTNSTISNNTASDAGAGVYNEGDLILTRSTISGNRAPVGAGIYNSGRVIATNSTISENSASIVGGGVLNYGNRITLTNCTISGNTADQEGGGIHNFAGIMTLARCLISGNKASDGAEVNDDGDIRAVNFNLFGHKGLTNAQAIYGFTPGPTDITATSNGNDPTAFSNILNTTLANNGGPTRTHALVAGSPAIDTVTDGTCPPPSTDQRGVRRPQDGNNDGVATCDTGSFERQ